ncbi:hypothetical protein CCP2SC5_240032 [Azospirillaceae bacterium]
MVKFLDLLEKIHLGLRMDFFWETLESACPSIKKEKRIGRQHIGKGRKMKRQ